MATSYYSTGTVSLTNGSAVVTGNGTLWQAALIAGGNIIVQASGNLLPIASVDGDSQITSELQWTGATGTYSYAIQRDSAYRMALDQNSENLSYLLSELRNGTIFKYDATGDLAGRALYNERPKGFSYLVLEGENAQLYVKASNSSGDWAGPFGYGAGEIGPAPTLGIGAVTTLAAGQPASASVTGGGGSYNLNLGLPAGELTEADIDILEAATASASASATEAEMYALMVGAAVYDFNFDTDPETPGLDWND